MNDLPEQTAPRSRRQAWILVVAFFAPLALAFLLYYGGSHFGSGAWRPAGSTNKGDLIHPARPLPAFELTTTAGTKLDLAGLHGKWNVVFIGDGQCDARCREALVLMRQTRLALNDDMTRVQRVFLVTRDCCDRDYLATEHDGLMVAALDDTNQPLLAMFPDVGQGRIYIVDPLGNLMMSYGPDAPQKGLLEDLKKLLKLSHIG
ncbi:MAG TPA: SCO family protein [Povalibacter sp.]|uniref:SCO family protein n=1 Tax=Povalibacter sp. TaxID=1962978 RepID=UPI002CF0C1EA|nr:SCO family protein [Povalibacter sp.]HMN44696.1 SCO family protein [Povalibacter sp.]